MIQFAHPEYLPYLWLALLAVPLLVWYMRWRRKKASRLASPAFIGRVMPGYSSKRTWLRPLLIMGALLALLIALADPRSGSKPVKGHKKGLDAVFAIDVSSSMLAEDLQPDRLARAKQLASQLIKKMGSDRVGLVIFAGNAYIQMPLSSDHSAALMFLDALSTDMIRNQGTNIKDAIEVSRTMLQPNTEDVGANNSASKVIILFSDGEEHDPQGLYAARKAAEAGLRIYTIGIGTVAGAPLPVKVGGRVTGYLYDNKGQKVISRLNEAILEDAADAGNGKYYLLKPQNEIAAQLVGDMDQLQRSEQESTVYTDMESRFQWFIGLALILVLVEYATSHAGIGAEMRRMFKSRRNPSAAIIMLATGLLSALAFQASGQGAGKLIRRGNEAYKEKDYKKAQEDFNEASRKEETFASVFNEGTAVYQQGDHKKAAELFDRSLKLAQGKEQNAQAWYNLGNAHLELKEWDKSIAAYKKSLKNNPTDIYAKYNLSYALRKKKEEEQEKQKQQPPPQAGNQGQNQPPQQPGDDENGGQKPDEQAQQPQDQGQQDDNRGSGELDRAEAERLLDAMRRDEEKIRERMSKQGQQGKPQEDNQKPW